MRTFITLTVLAAFLTGSAAMAEPGGCLKYGAGGAAAGHFVGQGHAVAGGAAGCAIGAYKRHEYRKDERDKASAYDREHH